MEIKNFQLIKSIVEEGSIANSSEKLFLTPSALSHQLRELEERLNFKIFIRSRNHWQLTEEGLELYQLGSSILEQLDKGLHHIDQLRKGTSGTIRMSTECYSFYQGLSTLIQKTAIRYPKIKVEFILEATHHPIPKLLAHEIDIALVTKKPTDPELSTIAIYEDEIYALIHASHPLHQRPFLNASDFNDLHLIIHSFPLETVAIFDRFLKPHHCTPKKISAIPLTEVALEIVQANLGVMCMPKWALRSFQVSKNISFKRCGQEGLKRTHYLVFRTVDQDKKYLNDFITILKQNFEQH